MTRTLIGDLKNHIDESVTIKGWVDVVRHQSKMSFLNLRDRSGKIQCVAMQDVQVEGAFELKEIRPEWVVAFTGTVVKRPEKNVNPNMQNGDIEMQISKITLISKSETPPFDISADTSGIDEDARLKYRYLDLRSERMQKNIRTRSAFIQNAREFLFKEGFVEIETPLLTESTPEGSRDFVVPSRLNPGKFYALPQSPQQYKQLLMVGGMERYFQIARAIRDEDLRADRGFEHTQIDLEMSFVEMEDVMSTVEAMITQSVEKLGYKIKEKPFPRISYKDAMAKYGADKFDMRTEEDKANGVLAFAWVVNFPFFEKTDPSTNSGQAKGEWTFTHNPFSMPIPEHVESLLKGENIGDILTTQYDLVCNGFETGGGSIRAHDPEILKATYRVMGNTDDETQEKVGHMLEAFKYGAPPHGGIAIGVERIAMTLANETQLREVQAFPMTRGGQTSVMKAPKELTKKQLNELGLELKKKQ
ncbi:aspartate--tRNA ligase [Patescibacteria group bacterium]|nr:aspartate--tRNA ligase [Patescibacteria group bacterium]